MRDQVKISPWVICD